jgi:hypothetical protein
MSVSMAVVLRRSSFFTPSTHTSMRWIALEPGLATAEMWTGELTVAPSAGAQIFTVRAVLGAVHVGVGPLETVMFTVCLRVVPSFALACTVSRRAPLLMLTSRSIEEPLTVATALWSR